jgi:ubiquinone biosynthesis protein
MAEISIAQLLGQLFQVTETFAMETQPHLLLLQKTMLMAEGLSRKLSPEENMWELCQPMIERWVRENLGPEARLREAVRDSLDVARRIPSVVARAERALEALEGGVKLDAETAKALSGRRSRLVGVHAVLGLIALLLAALLAVQLY